MLVKLSLCCFYGEPPPSVCKSSCLTGCQWREEGNWPLDRRMPSKERISRADVEKHIVGGWKSVAIYELDKNKSIVATKKLKSDLPASSEEPLVDYFEIKGFGKNQLIQYGLLEGRYENLDFAYDESDNSLSLDACWHVAHNGKLVYLSDGIMVCVDAKRWGTEEKPLVYMVVFEKVSDSTLGEWRKECPAGGLWV